MGKHIMDRPHRLGAKSALAANLAVERQLASDDGGRIARQMARRMKGPMKSAASIAALAMRHAATAERTPRAAPDSG